MREYLAGKKTHLFFLILASSAVLRFAFLGSFSYFIDEIHAMNFASGTLIGTLRILGETPGTAPLDYALVNLLSSVSTSEWFMRLPYAAAGVLSVWYTHKLARRWFGDKRALISSALVAFSTAHIYYSQSIRCYSLGILLVLVAVDAYDEIEDGGGVKAAVRFSIVAALAVLNQFFAMIPLGLLIAFSAVCICVAKIRGGALPRAKLLSVVLSSILIAAVVLVNLELILAPKSLGVMRGPEAVWVVFVLAAQSVRAFIMFASLGKHALGAFVFLLFIIGLISMLFGATRRFATVFIVALLPVPFIIFQEIRLRSGVHLRHIVYAMPYFMIAASCGIDSLAGWLSRGRGRFSLRRLLRTPKVRRRSWELVICIALALMMLQSVKLYLSEPYRFNGGEAELRPDLRSAAVEISRRTHKDDCLVTTGIASGPWIYSIEFYLKQMGRERRFVDFADIAAADAFDPSGCNVKFIFFDFPYIYTRDFTGSSDAFRIRKLNDFAFLFEPVAPVRDERALADAAERFAYLLIPPADFGIYSQAYTNLGIAAKMKGDLGRADYLQDKAADVSVNSLFKNVFDEIEARREYSRTLTLAGDASGAYDQIKWAEKLVPRRMSMALAQQLRFDPAAFYSETARAAEAAGFFDEAQTAKSLSESYAAAAENVKKTIR